jgi:hypothetical protein
MRRTLAGLVVLSVSPLAGCGGGGEDKYEQTWDTAYSSTTCTQFAGEMTDDERFAMAADMITGAATDKNPDAGLPPDSLVKDVVSQMSTACEAEGSVVMTDIAVGLFMIDSSLYTY